MPITTILGVQIDQVTPQSTLDQIEGFIAHRRPHQIVTVNPEFIVLAHHDHRFRSVLNNADLAVPDGAGLLWASRILDRRNPHSGKKQRLGVRVTGTDLLPALARKAQTEGWTLYFLGGQPGIAQRAADRLSAQFPRLRILGAESGPLLTAHGTPLNRDQAALLEATISRIRHAKPDLLFVALGAPKQDYFIAHHKFELGVPVMIGVGGAFDFFAGKSRRAPILVQRLWLEWLWRLILEPWRFPRMWRSVVVFPSLFIRYQLLQVDKKS